MTIGELNMRVTIENWTSSQDGTTGNVSSSLTSSWSKAAKIEMNNGNRTLDQAAITYRESYTVWIRYEPTRVTFSNYKLNFYNKRLTIHSVTRQYIGKIWYEQILAFTQT